MVDPEYGLRPEIVTFDHLGCQITLVDPAQILRASAREEVSLLHDAAFPAPVREVSFTVSGDVLLASVRTGPPRAGLGALGNDPVGVLLGKRVAAGEPWATRVVDGVNVALAEVNRRLGLTGPKEDGELVDSVLREDRATGLRAVLTTRVAAENRKTYALRAVLSREETTVAHLQAMFRLVLDTVAAVATGPLAGRYVLSRYRTAAGPEAEHVTLAQVGGLDEIVAQFREVAASFRHPQAMARWGARRPQGILLYGPPGTGKTMLAHALANEIGAQFREIRTPEILDKWLGASERNIKRIFRDARRYQEPTVMLFDEFDSIISYTGGGQDAAGQAINAVAGIFKQEMNGLIEANPNVIVVATTNFPHRVDKSLIRSGRFDIKLAIPVPDEAGRRDILVKAMRQLIVEHEVAGFRMFADDVDVADLAAACHGMTGADLKELLRRAQLAKAMHEARSGNAATPISHDDLTRHLAEFRRQ
jgi:transitional endoplasmic reticulum ATPase